jgi:hypothetical protein
MQKEKKVVAGRVQLAGAKIPAEVQLKLRFPSEMTVQSVTVNGARATLGGARKDRAQRYSDG